jgi:hypothetical protein
MTILALVIAWDFLFFMRGFMGAKNSEIRHGRVKSSTAR